MKNTKVKMRNRNVNTVSDDQERTEIPNNEIHPFHCLGCMVSYRLKKAVESLLGTNHFGNYGARFTKVVRLHIQQFHLKRN